MLNATRTVEACKLKRIKKEKKKESRKKGEEQEARRGARWEDGEQKDDAVEINRP